ncbi:sensor histidine kinase [Marinoscillum furvescens]|uniref:sensor histidine kinase n=1 Tax=Marinoscillum furvescens TaxID=1026 RepID=UPI0014757A6F|nr:histidine kinase [Marinoscillum furvescens]
MSNQKRIILYHVIFWLGYFTFNSVRWGHYFSDYIYSIKSNLVEFPIHIVLVYFHLYWLVPKLLTTKKYVWYGVGIFSATLIMSLVKIILTYYLVTTDIWPESAYKETNLFGISYLLSVFVGELYIVGLTAAIKFTIDRIRERDAQRELEKNSLETELAYLKSQIQPHFFFNTLNSLYALTLDKSELAPNTILKLSNMMSFVIYRAKANVVSLMETVTHMKNYIELEKIRFGDKLNVDLQISGQLEGQIPPLILSPFLENSIKHGEKSEDGSLDIQIQLDVSDANILHFQISNQTKTIDDSTAVKQLNGNEGIGLTNTIRRLKLLYQDEYDLKIDDSNGKYRVDLKIPLNPKML